MPEGAALLMEDETILRLFPVLRRAWSMRGEQARVPITGRNARLVLYGTISLRTGHRVLLRGVDMGQGCFHALLREVRRRYKDRPVWMLLDEAMCHVAAGSEKLAVKLNIKFVWLPKQCPELNSEDQLWKELRQNISANYQYSSIYEHTDNAENWLLGLSNSEALRKAGVLSKNFWLKSFVQ